MRAFSITIAGLILGLSTSVYGSGLTVSHHEVFDDFTLKSAQQLTTGAASDSPEILSFNAFGKSFDIQLTENKRFIKGAARAALTSDVRIYRGEIAGEPGSWARLSIIDGIPQGFVWDGSEMYAIEGPDSNAVNASTPVMYRLADTYITPGTMTCGAGDKPMTGAAMYQSLVSEIAASVAPGATHEMELSAIGDGELAGVHADPEGQILNRLNIVDGIFSEQLGLQIVVSFIETFNDAAADPFTDETDANLLIDEVSDHRVANADHNSRALTHMYTGKDLDGATVGIAFTADIIILCNASNGVGISQGNINLTTDALIAAHEIGHNFGAPHDGDAMGACAAEPDDAFIMGPILDPNNDQFSDCSKDVMQPNIDAAIAAMCINPLPSVDMSVSLSGQAPTVLLGNSVSLTYDVTNLGSVDATNVSVDITLPGTVTFVSIGSTAGSCTSGTGTANCQLGTMAGGAAETVTVSAITDAVGTATFDATVSADADDDPANDMASTAVTVDPAIDLAVTIPANQTVDVGASRNYAVTIENLATIEATNLTLSITADSGIQPDTATWTIGTCTITGQSVDCTAAALGSQTASTLTIGVSGQIAGSQNVTLNVSATETDRDTSNNNATGTFTVNQPNNNNNGGGGGGSDSGGGSAGYLLLGMLSLLLVNRRRRFV